MKNFQHGAVTFKADILNFFSWEEWGPKKKKKPSPNNSHKSYWRQNSHVCYRLHHSRGRASLRRWPWAAQDRETFRVSQGWHLFASGGTVREVYLLWSRLQHDPLLHSQSWLFQPPGSHSQPVFCWSLGPQPCVCWVAGRLLLQKEQTVARILTATFSRWVSPANCVPFAT